MCLLSDRITNQEWLPIGVCGHHTFHARIFPHQSLPVSVLSTALNVCDDQIIQYYSPCGLYNHLRLPCLVPRGISSDLSVSMKGIPCSEWTLITLSRPLKAYWDFVPPTWHPHYPYKCRNIGNFFFISSIVNTVQDFVMIILPIPIVWKLELPLRQRIAVISVFFLGLIVCAAGIMKLLFIIQAMILSYDSTWVGWVRRAGPVDFQSLTFLAALDCNHIGDRHWHFVRIDSSFTATRCQIPSPTT